MVSRGGCLAVAGVVRLMSRIEPPNVGVQLTMQVLSAAIQSSRVNVQRLNELTVTRLLRFSRNWPELAVQVDPVSLALDYVTGMKYPVESCSSRVYGQCFYDENMGAEWTKRPVDLPPQGLWE